MNAVKIRENIYWVGAIDWNIRNFHGYETPRGTTYGAYLILDEKITLIDTVKASFTEEMLSRIRSVIAPEQIDIIISNHVEMDHSGALPLLLQFCPQAQVYTSGSAGQKGLNAHYGIKNAIPMASGSSLSLGSRSLTFLSTPMLHWPDNMVTYCKEENILFSNDAFGQHLATSERFDEETNLLTALEEAQKYYANILMCYGRQAWKAWEAVCSLQPEIIAPSHGIIWKGSVKAILNAYKRWCSQIPESGALVVYDSMWQSTETIARTIAEAFADCNIRTRIFDLKASHPSAILPWLLECRYLAVGSPTLNRQLLPTVAGFLCYLKGLSPGQREAFAFGSYGWSGQSVSLIEKELSECGFSLCMDGFSIHYRPDKAALDDIRKRITEMISPYESHFEKENNITMKKYMCEPCGYIYDPTLGDPDSGIAPGTAFENLPEDWICPICGLGKDVFVEMTE